MDIFYTGDYEGELRGAILRLKLNNDRNMVVPLGARLTAKVKAEPQLQSADMMIPVPRYEKQSNIVELLADCVGRDSNIMIVKDCLYLNRDIGIQAKLDRQERFKNVAGAFAVRNGDKITGKRVVLLDDIYTTGATVTECRNALVEAGAKEVLILVAAKTPKEVSNMAIQFIGNLDRKKNKDGTEWFAGYIGKIPVAGNFRKNNPDKLDISLDVKSINWRAEQPIPEKKEEEK